MSAVAIIVKDTHRALYYEDGVLLRVLGAGRYELPLSRTGLFRRRPKHEVVYVDVRSRELTIKGQEILTSDKVAIRVNILVQFTVVDPKAAIHAVEKYEDRLYSDVQLAARRSLAAMSLEEILTNRTRLSADILEDVKEEATSYGVSIHRADVKDLVFPGNLQEIMNRVLAAERMSEAQLVESRTKAEVQRIEAESKLAVQRLQAAAEVETLRVQSQAEAEAVRTAVEAEVEALRKRAETAAEYAQHPALLRLEELAALRSLAANANARMYLDFRGRPGDQAAES